MSDPVELWWDATRERRLLVQRCEACGVCQHHPRTLCLSCGATDALSLVPSGGTGAVWSFTDIHRAPAPDVDVPYTVALVRLDEGPVLLTHLVYAHPRCDDRVRLDWRPLDDGRHLPVFMRDL